MRKLKGFEEEPGTVERDGTEQTALKEETEKDPGALR